MADWDTITTGSPTLMDAIAVFDCRLIEHKVMSTHMVLFGEVVGLRTSDAADSLLFLDRQWRTL